MIRGYFTKALRFIIVLSFLFFEGCNNDKNPVNSDEDLTLLGIWEVNLMSSEFEDVTDVISRSQLDSIGIIWTLEFEDDHSAIQITNMSGPLISMAGTWENKDTELLITLTGPSGSQSTLTYEYFCDDSMLSLEWQMNNDRNFHAEFIPVEEEVK